MDSKLQMIGQSPVATSDDRPTGTGARPELPPQPPEIGGREGPEPTRFGDWEKNGRCIDF